MQPNGSALRFDPSTFSSSSTESVCCLKQSLRDDDHSQKLTPYPVDRYNPQNLEVLHQYLGQQLDHGAYDSLANLAILKL